MKNHSTDVNFDELFKIMIIAMNVNRSHPDIPRDKKWVCQFLLMHGHFFFVFCLLVYSIIFHDLKQSDLTQACSNGTLCIIFSVVTYKYCIMLKYQKLFKALMNEMRVDYETMKSLPAAEQLIVQNYAQKGNKVVKLWLMIATCGGLLFIAKSILLMSYYSIREEFKFVHLYEMRYPMFVEEKKNEPVMFILLYVIILCFDIFAVIMYIAMSPLGPVFMLHGCGQLELVEKRLLNIFKDTDSVKNTLNKLNNVVIHLQKTYSFLEHVKESFQVLYELTLKFTVIMIPVTLYQIIESFHKGDLRIEFLTFIIGALTLVSIPCYYSDQLMNWGENVRLAVYMCGWEAHLQQHRGLRDTLLLIQARAARPAAIRTLFRTVSLNALTDIYHQSYAFFNFLNAATR